MAASNGLISALGVVISAHPRVIFGITSFHIWTMRQRSPSSNAHTIQKGEGGGRKYAKWWDINPWGPWKLDPWSGSTEATPETLLLVLESYIERDVGKPERGQ